MSSYTFDIPADAEQNSLQEPTRHQKILLEKAHRIQETARLERQAEEMHAARIKNVVVTIRMPGILIEGLDRVALDAGTNRSHLIRQIATEYMNYIQVTGIVYRGSLMSARDNFMKKP